MKLRFLGQSYTKPHNHLLSTSDLESRDDGQGKNYTLTRPVKSFKADYGLRKYRGVKYIELRFLGQY